MLKTLAKKDLVAEHIRDGIRNGTFQVGQSLPTENEFMVEFGVSRHTVRHALSMLRSEGLVSSVQGQGTKVISANIKKLYIEHIQSIGDLIALGQESKRVLLGQKTINADEKLATLFQCSEGRKLSEVKMLRKTVGGEERVLSVLTLWIDILLDKVVERIGDADTAAAEIVAEEYGIEARSVKQTIEAVGMNEEEAGYLGAQPGDPALMFTREYARDQASAPHLVARSVYHAKHTKAVSNFVMSRS
ncbi:MAG: GntR family transcriptional regulator [Hyphomicrobiales bacterium]|nr:GntR family transcriptional regulator [Hyphomicrobiales bacterium]